jgi:hypothetical protein
MGTGDLNQLGCFGKPMKVCVLIDGEAHEADL